MHTAFEHEQRIAALSIFTTQSATALMEKIRRQLDAAAPSPADFDLGPGTRTVFGLDPLVHTGVLNVPGGAIVEIARLSPGFRPLVELALATRTPSLLNGGNDGFTEDIPLRNQPPVTNPTAGAIPIQMVLENTEWVSQSSNPVAWAPHIRLDPLRGAQPKNVIVQFARGNQTAPNPTATALIRAGQLTDRATFFRNELAFAGVGGGRKTPHFSLRRPPPVPRPRKDTLMPHGSVDHAVEANSECSTSIGPSGPTLSPTRSRTS